MATFANFLKDVIRRAKLSEETLTSLSEIIENEEVANLEISEEDSTAILGGLHNLDTAKAILKSEIAKTVKAETLNGVDGSIRKIFSSYLTEDELASALSEDSSHKKLEKASEILFAKKPEAKGEDPTKIQNLNKAIEELNSKLKAKDDEAEAKIAEEKQKYQSELFKRSLETRILGRNDIAKESKETRHFITNILEDYNAYLKKSGLKVDQESSEVFNADDTPYFNAKNDRVSLDDLIGNVVEEYGYKQKSKQPERGRFEDDGNGNYQVVKKLNEDLWN